MPSIRHGEPRFATEDKATTGARLSPRFAVAQRGTPRPDAIEGGNRHRLCHTPAEANDLGRDDAAVACQQRQTVADRDVPAQSINIDHQTRQTAHASF